jgi:exodeoxyribonuclease V
MVIAHLSTHMTVDEIEDKIKKLEHQLTFLRKQLENARTKKVEVPITSIYYTPPWEDYPTTTASNAQLPLYVDTTTEIASVQDYLKGDQPTAWSAVLEWANSPSAPNYFALMGSAGSGKSTLVKYLIEELSKTKDLRLTATTNKAAKNLSSIVEGKMEVITIYSLLGLVMKEVEEEVVLTQSDQPVYFSNSTIIVIDEGGMCGTELLKYVYRSLPAKVLFIGDPFQLPPVGEKVSPAFRKCRELKSYAMMRKILRFDNNLVNLSASLRRQMKDKDYSIPDIETSDGILKLNSSSAFYASIVETCRQGPKAFSSCKVIAWRNKTVVKYNELIRKELGFEDPFCVGDHLLIAEPLENTKGDILASIDSELEVQSITTTEVSVEEYTVTCFTMEVTGDYTGTIDVPEDSNELDDILNRLSTLAKASTGIGRKKAWSKFWKVKKRFAAVRFGYALTAHRSQGSTLDKVWVDLQDILANHETSTAFRCLYVACTRPRNQLITY